MNQPLVPMRTNNLALAFQDAVTVILRVRHRTQRVADAGAFRESIRKMIASAALDARRMGYSDQTSQMALYAIIGFLDESVLNSQDPTFAAWARRPLQEEMFGGHFAGEYFFRHVADLLNLPESPEVADALELHALCLLLGYRGKFAFGDNGEIQGILQRIREKIARIRGPLYLCRVQQAEAVAAPPTGDPWVNRLVLVTGLIAILVLCAFASYWAVLNNGLRLKTEAAGATSLYRGLKPDSVAALMSGLKPGPISETTATAETTASLLEPGNIWTGSAAALQETGSFSRRYPDSGEILGGQAR